MNGKGTAVCGKHCGRKVWHIKAETVSVWVRCSVSGLILKVCWFVSPCPVKLLVPWLFSPVSHHHLLSVHILVFGAWLSRPSCELFLVFSSCSLIIVSIPTKFFACWFCTSACVPTLLSLKACELWKSPKSASVHPSLCLIETVPKTD